MPVRLKRVYDSPEPQDGQRILVDRLWPRGLSRERVAIADWFRDLGPSDDLRRWFGHDPARWEEFRRRYTTELRRAEAAHLLDDLADRARTRMVTLVYGAHDAEHNQARVIATELARRGATIAD